MSTAGDKWMAGARWQELKKLPVVRRLTPNEALLVWQHCWHMASKRRTWPEKVRCAAQFFALRMEELERGDLAPPLHGMLV